jgi:hypothetical protein
MQNWRAKGGFICLIFTPRWGLVMVVKRIVLNVLLGYKMAELFSVVLRILFRAEPFLYDQKKSLENENIGGMT